MKYTRHFNHELSNDEMRAVAEEYRGNPRVEKYVRASVTQYLDDDYNSKIVIRFYR